MKEMEQHLFELFGRIFDIGSDSRKREENKCQMSNLTDCQKNYLQIIDKNEPLTSGEFAKLICVSKPTVSQLINRFIKSGYVIKESCPTDKRVCYIRMTDKGRQIARIEEHVKIEVVQYIQTNLTEQELNQLIEILEKLN